VLGDSSTHSVLPFSQEENAEALAGNPKLEDAQALIAEWRAEEEGESGAAEGGGGGGGEEEEEEDI
jgi:hypothetical protein